MHGKQINRISQDPLERTMISNKRSLFSSITSDTTLSSSSSRRRELFNCSTMNSSSSSEAATARSNILTLMQLQKGREIREEKKVKRSAVMKRKRVHFSTTPDKINREKSSPLTMEEKQCIWYSRDENVQLKKEATEMTQMLRLVLANKAIHSPQQQHDLETRSTTTTRFQSLTNNSNRVNTINNDNVNSIPSSIEGTIDETRGLESRIFLRRQMEKDKARRRILDGQRKMKIKIAVAARDYNHPNLYYDLVRSAPELLARISLDCTQWAKDIARATGTLDREDAYQCNDELSPSVPVPPQLQPSSLPKRKKCVISKRSIPTKKRRRSCQLFNVC